jgi:hypothetical protein
MTMQTRLHRLHDEQSQSPWLDFVDRALITDGKLRELIDLGKRTRQTGCRPWQVGWGEYGELALDLGPPT